MSRYERKTTNKNNPDIVMIAYGYDFAVGFFFQAENAEGDAVIDMDTMFNRLTGVKLAQKLDEFGVDVPALHRNAMMADLQF